MALRAHKYSIDKMPLTFVLSIIADLGTNFETHCHAIPDIHVSDLYAFLPSKEEKRLEVRMDNGCQPTTGNISKHSTS